MPKRTLAALFGLCLTIALPPGTAAHEIPEESEPRERAEELARETMEQMLRALEMMVQSFPQYEMPEIMENGDIIIRRRRAERHEPPAQPETSPEPDFDETSI